MIRMFIACISVVLASLISPAFAVGNFTVLGQELGVSTYTKAKKSLASKATLSDGATDPVLGGKILKAIPKKGSPLEVNLAFDAEDRLAAITVQGDADQVKVVRALFASLITGLKNTSGVYTNGKGFVEMKKGELPTLLATTPAYKQAMGQARVPDTTQPPMAVIWAISLITAIGMWLVLVSLRKHVWRTRSGSWTKEGLLGLAMRIDLPGHDEIMPLAQRLSRVSMLLVPLASTLGWYALMVATQTDAKAIAIAVPAILLSGILIPALADLAEVINRHSSSILGYLFIIGFVIGAAYGLSLHESLLVVIGYAIGGGFIAAIGSAAAWMAGGLALGLAFLVAIAGYPLSWLILKIIVVRLNSRMRKHQWIGSNGKPILTLSIEGVDGVNTGDRQVFVPTPDLRRNGNADDFVIPKFTFKELCNQDTVKNTLIKHALTLVELAETDERFNAPAFKWFTLAGAGAVEVMTHNPATGLPTVDNMAGGMDVGGNMWGHDSNPATGMQTIGGPGTDDIGGNSYGFDHNVNNPM